MSYRGPGYRGPADRSRSPPPPRFITDRRTSAANVFDARGPPPRNASDAPRGPRSQFDGPPVRGGPPPTSVTAAGTTRTLRDAPPLGASERPRAFRADRDFPERRDRSPLPPPRERSPVRKFNDPRDFPPRDLDVRSARRASRDGPLSAGSSYSDNNPPFTASSFRGGFGRGRARGDFFDSRSGGRGGRRTLDDNRGDLFRRERSPPPHFARDLSRDSRDADRREDRRYERREDERRPDWLEREREREPERTRRDPPPPRLSEGKIPHESAPDVSAPAQSSQAPAINPERLAIIESGGVDAASRRPSASQAVPAPVKREPTSEKPAYLNDRVETTNNRYALRDSSPPTQAPPVPAFTFSAASTPSTWPAAAQSSKPVAGGRPPAVVEGKSNDHTKLTIADKPAPPANAPTAPKAASVAPRAHHASPPPSAPKAPRALELEAGIPSSDRIYGVRSMEQLPGPQRSDMPTAQQPAVPPSPTSSRQVLPHLAQTISPNPSPTLRFGEFSAPTGPKAARASPAQVPLSPRPTFAPSGTDAGGLQNPAAISRAQTPPLSAPSGPRKRSFSVSPKVATSSIPTAPKAARGPPLAPRAGERSLPAQHRPVERPSGLPPFAPLGPRSWTLWKRPGAPAYNGEKLGSGIPAKRDHNGDEKERQVSTQPVASDSRLPSTETQVKAEDYERFGVHDYASETRLSCDDRMDIDSEPIKRKSTLPDGHSAAQSFFGKTLEKSEDEIASSSEDDELDDEEDATLLEAKHARRERELKSQMYDLQAQQYRSTAPLESIARLSRLVVADLERLEAQRDNDMDLDDIATESAHLGPPAVNSSESDDGPDVVTPRGEEATRIVIREQEEPVVSVRRVRKRSPQPISLPYLVKAEQVSPLEESEVFRHNVKQLEESEHEIMAVLQDEIYAEVFEEEHAVGHFEEAYRVWRFQCEDLDREKEEQEKLERQLSAEPNPEYDVPIAPQNNPAFEGRRLLKFSSEYDIELVLKQSEETARIEQERQEREAKKKEADMEKEAILPDQQTEDATARSVIIDANRLRDPESLTLVFSYEPPADTFSEKEQEIFIVAFKDTPKKWGEIASLLPGRTYRDCIHHYYANKWDGRFRDNRAKKFKGGRRGRGGKGSRPSRGSALMADLNRNEDLATTNNDSITGRPKRAAAPTTFGEREVDSKSSLVGQSPAKRIASGAKDLGSEAGAEKPAKKPRRTGDSKPGRKGKAQLAALAAAPSMAQQKHFLPTKDEIARAQTLEDASLLANLQGGQHAIMHANEHMPYHHDGVIMGGTEDPSRSKPAAVTKQSASSYWSVPEQTDFFKYIAHFGTDFLAIASHMGTKTHTMIKNHYQRQIEGGRADLQESAFKANARRDRGEDIGPPPEPTPIVKRKYDNPQSSTPRVIAPQTDAMDIDEAAAALPSAPKHASPLQTQYQAKPRYTTSAQNTPNPPPRIVPSPHLATTAMPSPAPAPTPPAAHPRGLQHPLGSRSAFLAESRTESHPGTQPTTGFPVVPEQSPRVRAHPPPALSRSSSLKAPDPQLMHNLLQEQEKAMRMQAEHTAKMRAEQQYGRPPATQTQHTHESLATLNVPAMLPKIKERVATPPRVPYLSPPRMPFLSMATSQPSIFASQATAAAPPLSVTPLASLQGRGSYHPPPSKLDSLRPGLMTPSVSTQSINAQNPPLSLSSASTPAPAPEPPKRSNLSFFLNDEPEESRPAPKRDSIPSATARVVSPAPVNFYQPAVAPFMQSIAPPKREGFGQQTGSATHFHRSLLRQQGSSPPVPSQASLKQEPPSSITSIPQPAWPTPRAWGQGVQPSQSNNPPPSERDSRPPFYPHHRSSMLSGLNSSSRVNPSPPPHPLHSRTPSLTTQHIAAPMILGGPPPLPTSAQSNVQGLHSNPYAPPPQQQQQQQASPFSQAPTQAHNRVQHSHNSSIGDRTSTLAPFGYHEDLMRREDDAARAQQQHRDRERDWQHGAEAAKRQRDWDAQQRRQEDDMERQRQQQQAYNNRGQIHPSSLPLHGGGGSGFSPAFNQSKAGGGGGIGGLLGASVGGVREQSARETDYMMRHEQRSRILHQEDVEERLRVEQAQSQSQQGLPPQQQQQQQPAYMRDRDPPPPLIDAIRRRGEESMFQPQQQQQRRSTPYGGMAYAAPPPPQPPQPPSSQGQSQSGNRR